MISQRRWRVIGGLALASSAAMMIFSLQIEALRNSQLLFWAYWLVFLVCLIIAVFCAFLDLRYIRMQQAIAERELFRETLGEESFRKALRARQESASKQTPPES